MGGEFQREMGCFLVPGHGILTFATNNSPVQVNFEFLPIWQRLKSIQYTSVCMIHTHWPGNIYMSPIDRNMVYGWVQALAVPIHYIILTDNHVTMYLCKRGLEHPNVVDRVIVDAEFTSDFEIIFDLLRNLSTKPCSHKAGIYQEYPRACVHFNQEEFNGLAIRSKQ